MEPAILQRSNLKFPKRTKFSLQTSTSVETRTLSVSLVALKTNLSLICDQLRFALFDLQPINRILRHAKTYKFPYPLQKPPQI